MLKARQQEFVGHVHQGTLRRSLLESFLNETQQGTSVVTSNLQRAARIINDFKEIAIDREHIVRMPFDAGRDVEQIVGYVQSDWKQRAIVIKVEVEGDTRCDSYHGPFCQVVTNLVSNAFLHAFEGRAEGKLEVRLFEADSDTLCLIVTDNGCGMPEDDLERIFDPFFVGALAGTNSGLGLFVVYNIVSAVLGGRIEVDSVLGQGSRFKVWLPKQAPLGADESQFKAIALASRRRHNRSSLESPTPPPKR